MQNENRPNYSDAFGRANLNDVRTAKGIINFGKSNRYDFVGTVAAAIRYGYIMGKRESKEEIRKLHQRIHDQRTDSTANDSNELFTQAAIMAGQAVAMKAQELSDSAQEAPEADTDITVSH